MLRQGCSSTSHQRLTLLPVCSGLRKTLSSSCFILNLCRQTLLKIIYSYKQLCMKHRVRAVVPSWLTRVFSMLILFYLNVCAERNEEELLLGLLACQSLAIIIRHLTVSAFTPWGGQACPLCCSPGQDMPGCHRDQGKWAQCYPWAGALNPMLFLLSAAKGLLMRTWRLTRRLSYVAATEINDSEMAKATNWLWERQLLPAWLCLLESAAARSCEVAEAVAALGCCRSWGELDMLLARSPAAESQLLSAKVNRTITNLLQLFMAVSSYLRVPFSGRWSINEYGTARGF